MIIKDVLDTLKRLLSTWAGEAPDGHGGGGVGRRAIARI